jgi:hypothetical protein
VSKNFWISAKIINLINYFCCKFVLYYFITMFCTVFDFGGCSIEICLLYCIVCVCFVCVLCGFFNDKFHVWLWRDRICGPLKWCMCVCMYYLAVCGEPVQDKITTFFSSCVDVVTVVYVQLHWKIHTAKASFKSEDNKVMVCTYHIWCHKNPLVMTVNIKDVGFKHWQCLQVHDHCRSA